MFKAIIEMPQYTKYKYENKCGTLVVDRVLNVRVPYNYGFIEDTIAQDGDQLDVFVIGEPIHPNTKCNIEIIGVFLCEDNGVRDDKVVARVLGDTTDFKINDIEYYLKTYKPCGTFIVKQYLSTQEAEHIILNTQTEYDKLIDEFYDDEICF